MEETYRGECLVARVERVFGFLQKELTFYLQKSSSLRSLALPTSILIKKEIGWIIGFFFFIDAALHFITLKI